MPFCLIWDLSDENDPESEKLVRAVYATKKDALAQAEHDMTAGYRVVCIEEVKKIERDHMNRGKVVWEPEA